MPWYPFSVLILIGTSSLLPCGHAATPWSNTNTAEEFMAAFLSDVEQSNVFSVEQVSDMASIGDTIMGSVMKMAKAGNTNAHKLHALNMAFASSMADIAATEDSGSSLDAKTDAIANSLSAAFYKTTGKDDKEFVDEIRSLIRMLAQSADKEEIEEKPEPGTQNQDLQEPGQEQNGNSYGISFSSSLQSIEAPPAIYQGQAPYPSQPETQGTGLQGPSDFSVSSSSSYGSGPESIFPYNQGFSSSEYSPQEPYPQQGGFQGPNGFSISISTSSSNVPGAGAPVLTEQRQVSSPLIYYPEISEPEVPNSNSYSYSSSSSFIPGQVNQNIIDQKQSALRPYTQETYPQQQEPQGPNGISLSLATSYSESPAPVADNYQPDMPISGIIPQPQGLNGYSYVYSSSSTSNDPGEEQPTPNDQEVAFPSSLQVQSSQQIGSQEQNGLSISLSSTSTSFGQGVESPFPTYQEPSPAQYGSSQQEIDPQPQNGYSYSFSSSSNSFNPGSDTWMTDNKEPVYSVIEPNSQEPSSQETATQVQNDFYNSFSSSATSYVPGTNTQVPNYKEPAFYTSESSSPYLETDIKNGYSNSYSSSSTSYLPVTNSLGSSVQETVQSPLTLESGLRPKNGISISISSSSTSSEEGLVLPYPGYQEQSSSLSSQEIIEPQKMDGYSSLFSSSSTSNVPKTESSKPLYQELLQTPLSSGFSKPGQTGENGYSYSYSSSSSSLTPDSEPPIFYSQTSPSQSIEQGQNGAEIDPQAQSSFLISFSNSLYKPNSYENSEQAPILSYQGPSSSTAEFGSEQEEFNSYNSYSSYGQRNSYLNSFDEKPAQKTLTVSPQESSQQNTLESSYSSSSVSSESGSQLSASNNQGPVTSPESFNQQEPSSLGTDQQGQNGFSISLGISSASFGQDPYSFVPSYQEPSVAGTSLSASDTQGQNGYSYSYSSSSTSYEPGQDFQLPYNREPAEAPSSLMLNQQAPNSYSSVSSVSSSLGSEMPVLNTQGQVLAPSEPRQQEAEYPDTESQGLNGFSISFSSSSAAYGKYPDSTVINNQEPSLSVEETSLPESDLPQGQNEYSYSYSSSSTSYQPGQEYQLPYNQDPAQMVSSSILSQQDPTSYAYFSSSSSESSNPGPEIPVSKGQQVLTSSVPSQQDPGPLNNELKGLDGFSISVSSSLASYDKNPDSPVYNYQEPSQYISETSLPESDLPQGQNEYSYSYSSSSTSYQPGQEYQLPYNQEPAQMASSSVTSQQDPTAYAYFSSSSESSDPGSEMLNLNTLGQVSSSSGSSQQKPEFISTEPQGLNGVSISISSSSTSYGEVPESPLNYQVPIQSLSETSVPESDPQGSNGYSYSYGSSSTSYQPGSEFQLPNNQESAQTTLNSAPSQQEQEPASTGTQGLNGVSISLSSSSNSYGEVLNSPVNYQEPSQSLSEASLPASGPEGQNEYSYSYSSSSSSYVPATTGTNNQASTSDIGITLSSTQISPDSSADDYVNVAENSVSSFNSAPDLSAVPILAFSRAVSRITSAASTLVNGGVSNGENVSNVLRDLLMQVATSLPTLPPCEVTVEALLELISTLVFIASYSNFSSVSYDAPTGFSELLSQVLS